MTVLSPPPAIIRHHVPIGPKIAGVALALVGTRNSRYLPHRPRRACAAFVSTVLIRAGALKAKFRSASAAQLTRNLIHAGWRKVAGPVAVTSRASDQNRPGDVLAFGPRRGGIRHVGVAIGGDRFVGTSSSQGRVRVWTLDDWRSQRAVRLYRHRY